MEKLKRKTRKVGMIKVDGKTQEINKGHGHNDQNQEIN